jgi:hypothetical protein
VSLLWRDRLYIALSPERVTLARVGRGLHAQLGARQSIVCGEGGWEDVLAEALRKPEWSNTVATVILSNHLLRYQVVPWREQLDNAEVEALMRHTFSEVYGPVASGWELRWHSDKPATPWLASAVEQALLARVQAILAETKIRLYSVQPYLMTAFNHWRNEFKGGQQWFVLGEPERACICLIRDGSWVSVGNYRIDQDRVQENLQVLLEREVVLSGCHEMPQDMLMLAPDDWGLVKGVRRLQAPLPAGLSAAEFNQYAMALEGIN